ncbi:HTH-type transcriptional regulator GltC [Pelotomaculum schinkii]|uniref:HTH-type transcriptional regulator GltC n=1 Tax=Pelotomaculum schinkii TaxID=78350 RepID=A0A4Y7RAT1_9FIRM|nr:LysR substrate-binding domain-containing protein [Pelotomaculum schinkii]TEB06105.1 HTH-type transcriptional regulator GltC [Pelotomaculum schinkii]
MNLYQLYYFRTLAKLEHYTKAAEKLSLTQPSLSHAISALESELGVPLFKKQGRNVVLTKHGKLFLPYVENALREVEEGTKKIKEMSSDTNGIISIGFTYTISSHFIPNLITNFLKVNEHKNIKIFLHEGGTTKEDCTSDLINGLKDEKFDLIFVSLKHKDLNVEFIPIYEQEFVALLPYDCPLAGKSTIDLEDTKPYQLIHYAAKNGLKQEINRLFSMVNMVPEVCCEVEDETSMAGLVAASIGIAIVPYSPTFNSFHIKIRPISNPLVTRLIYLGYIKNRHLTLPVERFKNYILNNCMNKKFRVNRLNWSYYPDNEQVK